MTTLDSIKVDYPNPITADANEGLMRRWLEELPANKKTVTAWDAKRYSHINTYVGHDQIETDEEYPQCNYCVGGALQMALGEIEPHDDDARNGIFPSSDDLGDTLHYFCKIPYARTDTLLSLTCHFYEHKGQECVQSSEGMGETAYELADEITRANDRGDFGYAWSCVEVALAYSETNDHKTKTLS